MVGNVFTSCRPVYPASPHLWVISFFQTYELLEGVNSVIPEFDRRTEGQREAEHNTLIKQFQTCVGASKGLKDLILKAIDEDFLLELKEEGIAYLNVTPLQMLTHLRDRWGTMDFVDVTALLAECDAPWNAAEVPQKYFNRIEKA